MHNFFKRYVLNSNGGYRIIKTSDNHQINQTIKECS
ncbi:hypothetical protein [Bacillus phage BSTP8]|nr:hypothetical protein BSTP5_023 [Bacillus phage BSTP5]QRI44373.1 hypothetical protein [Bacillus phage BSTP8]QRI44394.1 hypothetical protein [Bacillus phage BSTP10]QRI44524.1 hypothetical protein [Bacillus phage BSTP12]